MEDTWASFTKYLLIIIILSILGINVFYYLARGTEVVAGATKSVTGSATGAVSDAVSLSAKGAETAVDIAAPNCNVLIKIF